MAVDPTTMWMRILDHGGAALAFSTVSVISGFIGTRRYVGHRWLLLHGSLVCALRSILSIYLMIAAFRADQRSIIVTALLTISTVSALTFATHCMMALLDLQTTFTQTEAAEMMRRDRTADARQELMLYKFMAAENRNASANFLATTASTEVPK